MAGGFNRRFVPITRRWQMPVQIAARESSPKRTAAQENERKNR